MELLREVDKAMHARHRLVILNSQTHQLPSYYPSQTQSAKPEQASFIGSLSRCLITTYHAFHPQQHAPKLKLHKALSPPWEFCLIYFLVVNIKVIM